MKTIFTAGLTLALSGCQAFGLLPSLDTCEYVKYERRDIAIEFKAHCHLPTQNKKWGVVNAQE